MTKFFTPRFPFVASSWLKTFSQMSSIFNKQRFVIEPTFQFEDFEPTYDLGGMTAAPGLGGYINTNVARFLKLGSLLFVQINYNINLTAVGAPNTIISFTIPYNAKLYNPASSYGNSQGGGCRNGNAGLGECGTWRILTGSNSVAILREQDAAYTVGVAAARANFFVEVED